MEATDFHRELLLPPPTYESHGILPLVWTSKSPFWLEIHREILGSNPTEAELLRRETASPPSAPTG